MCGVCKVYVVCDVCDVYVICMCVCSVVCVMDVHCVCTCVHMHMQGGKVVVEASVSCFEISCLYLQTKMGVSRLV